MILGGSKEEGTVEGFRKFILRGNVVELAVAVVIGAAFTAVVTTFVRAFITPLLGVFGGVPDFASVYFTVNGSKFLVGEFINALLGFLMVALVVYFLVVLPMNKLNERISGPPPMKTRDCPECLSKIPLAARRCAFCTAEVQPVPAPV
jgi:large conductance mechanosensitive channel